MDLYFFLVMAFIATCQAGSTPSGKEVLSDLSNYQCKSKNAYYPIDGDCDAYIHCRKFKASSETCPDGLHFNPDAKWPEYPCGYPVDIPCVGRKAHPPQPTLECPNQYGYFPSPAANSVECGHYTYCVEGRAIDMECPVGLAFNPESSRCDWPDKVPTCNAEEFLGFSCPLAPVNEYGEVVEAPVNYKYPGDCYYFFSCQDGHARVLSCDAGYAFNPAAGKCTDEEYVHCEYPKVTQ